MRGRGSRAPSSSSPSSSASTTTSSTAVALPGASPSSPSGSSRDSSRRGYSSRFSTSSSPTSLSDAASLSSTRLSPSSLSSAGESIYYWALQQEQFVENVLDPRDRQRGGRARAGAPGTSERGLPGGWLPEPRIRGRREEPLQSFRSRHLRRSAGHGGAVQRALGRGGAGRPAGRPAAFGAPDLQAPRNQRRAVRRILRVAHRTAPGSQPPAELHHFLPGLPQTAVLHDDPATPGIRTRPRGRRRHLARVSPRGDRHRDRERLSDPVPPGARGSAWRELHSSQAPHDAAGRGAKRRRLGFGERRSSDHPRRELPSQDANRRIPSAL